MKQITKEFLMQKMTEKYAQDNPELMKDIAELANTLSLFNLKWGTKLEPKDFFHD